MILGFKQQFADGTETHFREKILNGTLINVMHPSFASILPTTYLYKIHSLREDTNNRWKAGNSIQMAYGVRTLYYNHFNEGIAELELCKSTQEIIMRHDLGLHITVDGKQLQPQEIELLIRNDGLSRFQFNNWFFGKAKQTWKGKIIHWTDFKY